MCKTVIRIAMHVLSVVALINFAYANESHQSIGGAPFATGLLVFIIGAFICAHRRTKKRATFQQRVK